VNLIWSRRATRDLEQIGAYISLNAPESARSFVQTLIERAKQAEHSRMQAELFPSSKTKTCENSLRAIIGLSTRSIRRKEPLLC